MAPDINLKSVTTSPKSKTINDLILKVMSQILNF